MLAQTVDRVAGIVPLKNICVLTTRAQFKGCQEACPNLPPENFVAEWVGRDTAAATGVAMLMVKRMSPGATSSTSSRKGTFRKLDRTPSRCATS